MFIKKQRRKDGRIYLSIVEGYRQDGRTRLRHIKSLGFFDRIQKEHGDVNAYCQTELRRLKAQAPKNELVFKRDSVVGEHGPASVELGPLVVLWCLYHTLNLGECLKGIRGASGAVDTLAYLVWSRIAHPDLDIRAHEDHEMAFPVHIDRSSDAICDALRIIIKRLGRIQDWIRSATMQELKALTIEPSIAFMRYGLTSYFIELRHRDLEAGDSGGPLVHFGILSLPQGLPLGYTVIEGASRQALLSEELLNLYAEKYPELPLLITAEGGRQYQRDMAQCAANGASFLFSIPLSGAQSDSVKWTLNQSGYEGNDYMRLKSRLLLQHLSFGHNVDVPVKEIAYWNRRLERRFLHDSAVVSSEIYRSIEYGTGLNFSKLLYDVLDYSARDVIGKQERRLDIDWGKIELNETTAGYRCLVTDLTDHDDALLVDAYQGLWRIQNNFGMLPWEHGSLYEGLSHKEFIEVHFFVSFIASYVLLLLRRRMSWRYSSYDVSNALRRLVGHYMQDGMYLLDYRSQIIKDIEDALGLDFSRQFMTQADIARLVRYAKNKHVERAKGTGSLTR